MSHRIITISRKFGSGGRTIGKKAAEKLGIPCYDSELLRKIAEESGFAEEYIKNAGEFAPPVFFLPYYQTGPWDLPTRTACGSFNMI